MAQTSWNKVADWYDSHLGDDGAGTYHAEVIMPGVLKMLAELNLSPVKTTILDLACGQGIFARLAVKFGYMVVGIDAAPELIAQAKKRSKQIEFLVDDAKTLATQSTGFYDAVVCILALQNIDDVAAVFKQVHRVMKPKGSFISVINHPYFRIPKSTSWLWDAERQMQVRVVDKYLSSQQIAITTHPGEKQSMQTLSFHRSLQQYMADLKSSGFAVNDIQEWVSHKVSEPGPKSKAEDLARREIPLFMAIQASKMPL